MAVGTDMNYMYFRVLLVSLTSEESVREYRYRWNANKTQRVRELKEDQHTVLFKLYIFNYYKRTHV